VRAKVREGEKDALARSGAHRVAERAQNDAALERRVEVARDGLPGLLLNELPRLVLLARVVRRRPLLRELRVEPVARAVIRHRLLSLSLFLFAATHRPFATLSFLYFS
jgi:hypothetical protein